MNIDFMNSIYTLGQEIIKSDDAYHARFKKKKRFDFADKNNVIYIESGDISVCRIKDNVLVLSIQGPAIVGLSLINEFSPCHYMRCESNCDCYIMSNNQLMNLINEKNLWKHAFSTIVETVQKYMVRDSQVLQKNVRSLVFENLRAIWNLDEDIRNKTSIYSYILERNHVSRTAIHQVVKALKHQGVIDTVRGRLTYFNDRRR